MNDTASPPRERDIEQNLLTWLSSLKYVVRDDIRDLDGLKQNFRARFEELNQVSLTDGEFARLLRDNITPDVFAASKRLRAKHSFERDDGTPLNYTLVNLREWCKNKY